MQYDPQVAPHGVFNLHPLSDCEPVKAQSLGINPDYKLPSNFLVTIGPNPPFTPFLMALVTQSARGELALVDTTQNKLVDVDPLKPGYGFLPVGKLPEHVRATADSCYAVTANTDSCDYAVIDVSTLIRKSQQSLFPVDMGGGSQVVDLASGVQRQQLTVDTGQTDGSGKPVLHALQSRPSWVEMAADNTAATQANGQCTGGVDYAWVALPACQVVVKMQFQGGDPTHGNVKQAIRVTQTGASVLSATELAQLDCPVECAGDPLDGGTGPLPAPPTTATPDGGTNLPQTQSYPGTLAVDGESGRLVIGDLYGERVDIVPVDSTTGALGAPRAVKLETGASGVRIVRIGPRSEAGKFLYAIARDGTVRVVDLDREVECETNPDPRFVQGDLNLQQTPTSTPPLGPDVLPMARRLGCFPLGDPSTPRREALATTPGITLAAGQLPTDIAFIHVDSPPGNTTASVAPPAASPGLIVGDFAWIITSDGRGVMVNIFDACPAPNQQSKVASANGGPYTSSCLQANVAQSNADTHGQAGHPEAMLLDRVSHRLRAGHPRFALPLTPSDTSGQPRVIDPLNPCSVAVPPTSSGAPDGGTGSTGACTDTAATLPSLISEPVPDVLQDTPQLMETRIVRFPDPDRVRNETWVLSWEGVLPGTNRALGRPDRRWLPVRRGRLVVQPRRARGRQAGLQGLQRRQRVRPGGQLPVRARSGGPSPTCRRACASRSTASTRPSPGTPSAARCCAPSASTASPRRSRAFRCRAVRERRIC